MPWKTDEDVQKHKKGLTSKQMAQWRRIANSVLATCMKKGGTEKNCAASAIRQANGVVNTNSGLYSTYKNKQDADYEVELKVHQEKPHLVVPVVMMMEGVHNGSHGPLLHLMEDLGKFPGAWNGIPVVIDHPEEDGQNISANSPDIIDKKTVGRVYNTNVDGKKLKAEVWLDEEKLNEISPGTLAEVNDNKIVEVSVGVFTEEEETEGEYEGERYEAIARNHRPDHLALLTESVGACSVEDGCGLRANKEGGKDMEKKLLESIKLINLSGYSISQIKNYTEAGYRERMEAVYTALRGLDTSEVYHYLEEMYDSELIYSKSSKDGTKMYKQSYKFESGKIEFAGDPVEVHKKVEFIVNALSRTKFKEEVKMANECSPCVKKKVDDLIANSQGRWTEDDREFLQTLDEKKLDKLVPIEKIVEKEKEVQVNILSKEDQEALATYKKEKKEKREQIIKDIQANSSKELWPDVTLNGMDDDTLKRVFDSVKKEEVVDYSVSGGIPNFKTDGVEPLHPTGVEVETVK